MNLKEQFLSAQSLVKKVHIDELNTDVYLRLWGMEERADIHKSISQYDAIKDNPAAVTDLYVKVAIASLADENGSALFSQEDTAVIASKPAKALDRLFDEAFKFNRISEKEIEAAKKN